MQYNFSRAAELKSLKGRKYLDAWCVYFWATTPVMISILTFTTYALLGNKLTAAKVKVFWSDLNQCCKSCIVIFVSALGKPYNIKAVNFCSIHKSCRSLRNKPFLTFLLCAVTVNKNINVLLTKRARQISQIF